MKFIFLVGGLVGFLTSAIAGIAAGRDPGAMLLDAMLGAVIGAFLFRWLWTVALGGMRETIIARQRAAEKPVEAKKKT
jgi:uncharacterized membrane protein YeaQ/YmgE (transglycosylase-associated protein family)